MSTLLNFSTLKQGDQINYPKKGAILLCHYSCTFSNGDPVDSSREKNQPFEFQLGLGEVIQAWEIVLPKMSLGQKILLTVPSEYAYGKPGIPGVVPGNVPLVFEIELLAIQY